MTRIRTCPGGNFATGKSVCEIDYDKIKALVLTKHGVKLSYDSLEAIRTACHADVPNRAYGFPTIINWEPNGGEAQTSQVGYGPNAYNGMSARNDALTLDRYRHYLRAQILRNVEEVFDMYLIDLKNNLYGLNDGTDTLAGVPVTIYPSGNDHPGASDKASLVVNVVYQDVEEYIMNLDVVPLGFNALSAVYGLMPVTLEKVGTTGSNYKVVEFYGKGDATAKYGALIAENVADVITGASAATYDSTNNYITLTLATGADAPALKKASVLATAGIYGIEPYSAT
jgi:hypothetical protein